MGTRLQLAFDLWQLPCLAILDALRSLHAQGFGYWAPARHQPAHQDRQNRHTSVLWRFSGTVVCSILLVAATTGQSHILGFIIQ